MEIDDIHFASQFPYYRENNIRAPVEYYTIHNCMLRPLLDAHGSLTGKRVLDLACGHGHYTRQIQSLNCDYILGVDLSPSIIKIAQDSENQDPQGIEYMVADVSNLAPPREPFDLVTAFYLFDYAQTTEELVNMVRTIYACLGEGKQFVGIIGNVVAGKDMFNNRKYGITRDTKVPLDDGPIPDETEIMVTLYNENDQPVSSFVNYHYSPNTYPQIFKEIGFKTLEWVPYQYNPNAADKEFYHDLIKCSPSIGMVATK